jgi:hypothetical protein
MKNINMKNILQKVLIIILILTLNLLFCPKVEAVARLTNVSDTLTRLKITTAANHEAVFRITTALQGGAGGVGGTLGDKIVIDWNIGGFTVASLSGTDITLYRGGTGGSPAWDGGRNPVATRTVDNEDIFGVSSNVLTITIGNGTGALGETDLAANTWVKLTVGNTKITNPGTTGLKRIYVETTENDQTVNDDAYTAVFILTDDQVVLQATVEPLLSFAIQGGMNSGTEPTSIDFGTLEPNAYHKLLGAQCAYGSINISTFGNLTEGDTVTVRTETYTFKDTQAEADDDVKFVYIGQSAAQAAANLSRAINNNDASNVVANIDPVTSSKVWVMATACGTGGNSYSLATNDATAITVSGANFSGGQAGSNYKDANLGFGETNGTDMANGAWGTNLRVSTNAAGGYTITAQDASFSSGGNEIADWSGQYGFGLYAAAQSARYGDGTADIIAASYQNTASTPGTLSSSAATLASYTGTAAGDNIAIEYNVRVSVNQAAGLYADTITYIATSTY